MHSSFDYALLDFGGGRKLEDFGGHVLDRPCPTAQTVRPHAPDRWRNSSAIFTRSTDRRGEWAGPALPETWMLNYQQLRLQVKPTPFGHLGIFPEQAANWNWIAEACEQAGDEVSVLNLFAYTGVGTLVAASRGARVTHVDASKSAVTWARCNARLSSLEDAPVRWIIEDALRFVTREVKRGTRYDAVILDPPSYGHGPKKETWKIVEHLPLLLKQCSQLTGEQPSFVLLTSHSPEVDADVLLREAKTVWPVVADSECESGQMVLRTPEGRELPSGWFLRWSDC